MTDSKLLCYNLCYGAYYVWLCVTPWMVAFCLIKFHIKLYAEFRVLQVWPMSTRLGLHTMRAREVCWLRCNIYWVLFMKINTCAGQEVEPLPMLLLISFGCTRIQWSCWTCLILCWFFIAHTKQTSTSYAKCFYFNLFV